jgi:hypothetical protein
MMMSPHLHQVAVTYTSHVITVKEVKFNVKRKQTNAQTQRLPEGPLKSNKHTVGYGKEYHVAFQ